MRNLSKKEQELCALRGRAYLLLREINFLGRSVHAEIGGASDYNLDLLYRAARRRWPDPRDSLRRRARTGHRRAHRPQLHDLLRLMEEVLAGSAAVLALRGLRGDDPELKSLARSSERTRDPRRNRAYDETLRVGVVVPMTVWPTFRCHAAAEAPHPGAQRIHFVRHGETLHQQRARGRVCRCHASPAPEEIASCPYVDPDFVDPPLTETGRRQVARLDAEIWFAGAAMRSLETATLSASSPVVALEEIRSRVSAHPHTRRRPLSVLKPLFPRVDFSNLKSDEDPLFTGLAEPRAVPDRRLADFLGLLAARPERETAVVTHFTIFLTLFQSPSETLVVGRNPERAESDPPFFDCRDSADPDRLRSFFEPGEVRSLVIVP